MKCLIKEDDVSSSAVRSPDDYYIFFTIKQLSQKNYGDINHITNFQTIGILNSEFGRFYLTDVSLPQSEKIRIKLKVSHFKEKLRSTVTPYPVQVFGFIKWKAEPSFYAVVIKELPITLAIRLRNASFSVTSSHLVIPAPEENFVFEEIHSDHSDED